MIEAAWFWRDAPVRHRRTWFLLALLALVAAAWFVLDRLGDIDNAPPIGFDVPRRPPPADILPNQLLESVEKGSPEAGYVSVRMTNRHGDIDGRYYAVAGAREAVIWVGGAGGAWDTPAQGLYPRLCDELRGERIASLRVRFRRPKELNESVVDVLAGVALLQREGIETMALVGHSFGGAVVIRAATHAPAVRTVVTLATQSYGTDPVDQLGPRCSILLIHGAADRVLPAACSEDVLRRAKEPKRMQLLAGANHGLGEAADEVDRVVREWLLEQIRRPGR
jgi:pimeloyl-ACP methyl ester carboxylesterase